MLDDHEMLKVGDRIMVRLNGSSQAHGNILSISKRRKSHFVSYLDLAPCFDEYQPQNRTQEEEDVTGSGELSTSSSSPAGGSHNKSPNKEDGAATTVLCKLGGKGEVNTFSLG